MAQSNPENEIRYVESPKDRRVKARNAQSGIHLPEKRRQRRNHDSGEKRKGDQISPGRSRERAQEVVVNLLRCFQRHARNPVAGKLPSAAYPIPRAISCRDWNALIAKPRYSDHSDRRKSSPSAGTTARRPASLLRPSIRAFPLAPESPRL